MSSTNLELDRCFTTSSKIARKISKIAKFGEEILYDTKSRTCLQILCIIVCRTATGLEMLFLADIKIQKLV